jgi:transposase-like protein
MKKDRKILYRYSLAFKKKVVGEIERGERTLEEVRRIYGIGGLSTIQNWIKRLGKNHLLNKVVRIEMKDEKDRIKELEKEKAALEHALAHSQLKIITLESLIECVEEHYELDVKKNFGQKEQKKASSKAK